MTDTISAETFRPRIILGGREHVGGFGTPAGWDRVAEAWEAFAAVSPSHALTVESEAPFRHFVRVLLDVLFPGSRWAFWRTTLAEQVMARVPTHLLNDLVQDLERTLTNATFYSRRGLQ